MGNITGHIVEDSNIKFCFLSPNSTSILQPLDQEIFFIFECYYKRLLNKFINYNISKKNKTLKETFGHLDLVQEIHWIEESFDQITPTISST